MLVSPWISANSQSTRLLKLPLLILLVPLSHPRTLFLETLADGAAFRGPVLIDLYIQHWVESGVSDSSCGDHSIQRTNVSTHRVNNDYPLGRGHLLLASSMDGPLNLLDRHKYLPWSPRWKGSMAQRNKKWPANRKVSSCPWVRHRLLDQPPCSPSNRALLLPKHLHLPLCPVAVGNLLLV